MHHILTYLPIAAFIFSTLPPPSSAHYCSTSTNQTVPTTTTSYPSKCQIAHLFNYPDNVNLTAFFDEVVAPDVHWTLMGTHPLAGEYNNRTVFLTDSLERLGNTLVSGTSTLKLVHIVGGGEEEEWSVQELHATGVCKNGLKYDNTFAWVTRWNSEGIIVQVRAWFDSALVAEVIAKNESPEYTYTDQRTALEPGPVGIGCATHN